MIPGGPRNSREMQMMMRRLGMKTETVEDVEEVIVRTRDQEHVFEKPEVTILTVQGIRTYQVVGKPIVRKAGSRPAATGPTPAEEAPAAPLGPPDEDIALVMEQANVSREEAIAALNAADGAPAEAILHILSRRSA